MKAMSALITGLNIAYDETERRGIVKLYLTAFLLTLAGIVGAILVVSLIAVIPSLLHMLGGGETAEAIFSIARWPLLAALFMFGLSVVYRYAACRDKPEWRWVSWGAAAATILWLLGSAAFSFYVSSFGDYEGTYGSLGAVVVFLMWMYLTSYVILLGAELDAEMERQTKKDTTAGPEKPMGQRGAYAADTLGDAKGKK
jgi:membrane protein